MKIRIKTIGYLKDYFTNNIREGEIEIKPGTTVNDILKKLGVEEHLSSFIVLINNKIANLDTPIEKEAEIVLVPKVGGG